MSITILGELSVKLFEDDDKFNLFVVLITSGALQNLFDLTYAQEWVSRNYIRWFCKWSYMASYSQLLEDGDEDSAIFRILKDSLNCNVSSNKRIWRRWWTERYNIDLGKRQVYVVLNSVNSLEDLHCMC